MEFNPKKDAPKAIEFIGDYKDFDNYRVSLKIDVSYTDHSHIIGRGGMNVAKIMNDVDCHIHFPDLNKKSNVIKSNRVCIFGHPRDVEIARSEIRRLMPIIYHVKASMDKAELTALFRDVKSRFGVQIYNRLGHIQVKGTLEGCESVKSATKHVLDWLESHHGAPASVFMKLDISEQHHCLVRGASNKQLNRIMGETNTRIVPPNFDNATTPIDKLVYSIHGSLDSMAQARDKLIGSLPIVLMFDVPNYVATCPDTLRDVMRERRVTITWKVKNEMNVKSLLIKSCERNVLSVYQAGYDLLGANPSIPIPDLIPKSYYLLDKSSDEENWSWSLERDGFGRKVSESPKDFSDISIDVDDVDNGRNCYSAPGNKRRPFWRGTYQSQSIFERNFQKSPFLFPPPACFSQYSMACERFNNVRPFHSFGNDPFCHPFPMKSPLVDCTNRNYYDYAGNGYFNESYDAPIHNLTDRVPFVGNPLLPSPRYPVPYVYQFPFGGPPCSNPFGFLLHHAPPSPIIPPPMSPLFFNSSCSFSGSPRGPFYASPVIKSDSLNQSLPAERTDGSADRVCSPRLGGAPQRQPGGPHDASGRFSPLSEEQDDETDSHLHESQLERGRIKLEATAATERPVKPLSPRYPTVKWIGHGLSKSTPRENLLKSDSPGQRLSSSAPVETSVFSKFPLKLPCHIVTFLAYLNLEKFTNQFVERRIDFNSLLDLSEEDLKEVGVNTFGARKKIIWAIRDIKAKMRSREDYRGLLS